MGGIVRPELAEIYDSRPIAEYPVFERSIETRPLSAPIHPDVMPGVEQVTLQIPANRLRLSLSVRVGCANGQSIESCMHGNTRLPQHPAVFADW